MGTFALDASSSSAEIVEGLNYAIANLGTSISSGLVANVLVANITTGEISTTSTNGAGYATNTIVSYLYQYMAVKYANTSTGSSGFTSNSRLAQYYGLRNSANTTISSNAADYIWFEAAGGFGTTKSLWYQTIGGRQIAFFVGNASPDNSFVSVPDMPTANSTPLNLDTVTSAQNNQIVNVNAYYQANIVPATPSGGTYNFTTFALTAPSGWTANIPSTANTSVYISSAAFTGNSSATAAPPATSWTTPSLYATNFSANAGAPGERGFVPMGYVITASDPTVFSNAAFTTAYSSSRTNPSPPIGLGFAPIEYDTAQFAYQDLFTGNTITTVKQYDGAGWINVVGNVISGALFVTGSINANTLNTNQVYALTVASTNANVGNVTSSGFWLSSTTGDARLAGNTSIGNNLTVGQNAQFGANLTVGNNAVIGGFATIGSNVSIGGNLNVAGLVTAGSLQSNTVATTTMVTEAVSTGVGLNTNTTESYPFPNSSTLYTYTALQPSITTTINGQAVYVNAQVSFRLGFNSSALISVNTYLFRNSTQLGSVTNFYVVNGQTGIFTYLTPSFTFYDIPFTSSTGTATYSVGVRLSGTSGTNVSTLQFQGGTMVLQGMKR
jgi:hypothetical protein